MKVYVETYFEYLALIFIIGLIFSRLMAGLRKTYLIFMDLVRLDVPN